MDRREAVEAFEAFKASVSALGVVLYGAGSADSSDSEGSGDAADGDPLRQWSDDCLEGLVHVRRADAQSAALKVRLAAGYADAERAMVSPAAGPQERKVNEMAIVSEVAGVLTVSERSASAFLDQSHELTTTLPLTLAALQGGDLSWQHARVMVDETANLDPDIAASLEAQFLDPAAVNPAGELVPSRFRHKARTWRERHHPVSIEKRHAKSFLDRRLEYAPDRDGMAWLSAYLPADQAAGIWNGVTATARALQGPTEDRTMTQIRADVAAILLLGGSTNGTARVSGAGSNHIDSTADSDPGLDVAAGSAPANANVTDVLAGRVPSLAAQVLVTVPVFALMGLTDEPATLDGYGPIPASMARSLVAEGASSFHRVLTDPRDGAPLEIGRTSYRIPAPMRQWLRMRDGKCPFPGCSNQSLDNEADHLLAWADGGTTGISNLGQPCPKHHRLKHATAWTPTGTTADKPPGWISPTGRYYRSEHQDWEPPHWPAVILNQPRDAEVGPVVPENLPGQPPPEELLPDELLPGELLPEDPLPEWIAMQSPIDEQTLIPVSAHRTT